MIILLERCYNSSHITPSTAREFIQRRISKTLPCCSFNKTSSSRLYNQNTALDLRSILQSAAICLFTDSHAILHLRNYWDAGKNFFSSRIDSVDKRIKKYFNPFLSITVEFYSKKKKISHVRIRRPKFG